MALNEVHASPLTASNCTPGPRFIHSCVYYSLSNQRKCKKTNKNFLSTNKVESKGKTFIWICTKS